MKKIAKWFLIVLLILNGLFFITNIYVIGDVQSGIKMHDDLSPNASPLMVNFKVINVFCTGILYLISGIGLIINRKRMILTGVLGSIIFVGFYVAELTLWGNEHKNVWLGFLTLGLLSIIFGILNFRIGKKIVESGAVNGKETT